MKNVAIVVQNLHNGGAERMAANMSKELAKSLQSRNEQYILKQTLCKLKWETLSVGKAQTVTYYMMLEKQDNTKTEFLP